MTVQVDLKKAQTDMEILFAVTEISRLINYHQVAPMEAVNFGTNMDQKPA